MHGTGTENDIRDLFTYNLQRLAGISSRIALLELRPRFALSLLEWRALAVLGWLGDASVQALARGAGVEKSQMSRITAALERRKMLIRRDNPEDGRSSLLCLSDEGARLVEEIHAAARRRNEAMLSHLSDTERRQLAALLGKATEGAMELLDETRAATEQREARR